MSSDTIVYCQKTRCYSLVLYRHLARDFQSTVMKNNREIVNHITPKVEFGRLFRSISCNRICKSLVQRDYFSLSID